VTVEIDWYREDFAYVNEPDANESKEHLTGMLVCHGECPACGNPIVKLEIGPAKQFQNGYMLDGEVASEMILYPQHFLRSVEPEVPESYKKDYSEACAVLTLSPKASAALSRRLLQTILRKEHNIQHKSLAQEIDDFIALRGVPSHLSGAIDAIRNVGNFAAHPLKNTNTGEIVEVEPYEAEWLLEVLDALFDFTFVQPIRLKKRKDELNKKLQAIGKPPMKE
jgi:hypothetical protein